MLEECLVLWDLGIPAYCMKLVSLLFYLYYAFQDKKS